jgi:hypothetical protein
MMPSITTKFQYINNGSVVLEMVHWSIQLYISPEDGPYGPKHVVREKENKNELTYWNFVAIDGVIKNQLDRCATGVLPKGKNPYWCLSISLHTMSAAIIDGNRLRSTEVGVARRSFQISWKSKKKKLHGLSPRANYTDQATAACRRSDCQLLRIEGAMWSAWRIPTAVFSVS